MKIQSNIMRSAEMQLNKTELSAAVRRALGVGNAVLLLSISPMLLSNTTFGSILELSDLDGSEGFLINGIDALDNSGRSVSSAGDINDDGIDDLIIGADQALLNPFAQDSTGSGDSYVVFGGDELGSSGVLELSELDGSNGFVLRGIDRYDRSGFSVSGAGDINGDGVADLIIGARGGEPNARFGAGESYVVFGGAGVGSSGVVELSDLDGDDGFVLNGVDVFDGSGISVSSAGDVNGDGMADLIIGAYNVFQNGNYSSGASYVVFGGEGVGSSGELELSDLDGSDGFVLEGVDAYDFSGFSVSSAGDINGDNVSDLIIGAPFATPNGIDSAGQSYVVFGGAAVGSSGVVELSALDGSNGFVLNGIGESDLSGYSVSGAGDINGDGVSDLIIGAKFANPNGLNEGQSYVMFGGADAGSSGVVELSELDGSNGFALNGVDANDGSGGSVSSAGDINGDGMADLVIGAYSASVNGNFLAGKSYVVYGGNDVGADGVVELSDIGGGEGFVINGISAGDRSGSSVSSAGDVNADGVSDLVIGAHGADPDGKSDAGQSYVLFGKSAPEVQQCNGLSVTVDLNLGQTPTSGPDVILGTPGNDNIQGLAGNDTICGLGGDDFIRGNSGDDWIDGGAGVDNIRGDRGDDVIYTGRGATVGVPARVEGGSGNDEIFGGVDADELYGGVGQDTIFGNRGNDFIQGSAGNDVIFGGAGDDDLRGGQGDDNINGDLGKDLLSGGDGAGDMCDGGSDFDRARPSCEILTNVP